jgi:hypothetical protein
VVDGSNWHIHRDSCDESRQANQQHEIGDKHREGGLESDHDDKRWTSSDEKLKWDEILMNEVQ